MPTHGPFASDSQRKMVARKLKTASRSVGAASKPKKSTAGARASPQSKVSTPPPGDTAFVANSILAVEKAYRVEVQGSGASASEQQADVPAPPAASERRENGAGKASGSTFAILKNDESYHEFNRTVKVFFTASAMSENYNKRDNIALGAAARRDHSSLPDGGEKVDT